MSRFRGRFRDAVAVGLWCAVGWAAAAARPVSDAWQAANAARGKFEAQSAHTRAEYQGVMEGFRAIYHANPADVHAPAAVEQVAELLAEQGRELHDAKSLRDAAGQYAFLAKQYPASSLAAPALGAEVELFGPDGLGDAAEAKRVTAELRKTYPRSAAAVLARPKTAPAVAQDDGGKPATVKTPAGLSTASARSADSGRDDKVVAASAVLKAAISPLRCAPVEMTSLLGRWRGCLGFGIGRRQAIRGLRSIWVMRLSIRLLVSSILTASFLICIMRISRRSWSGKVLR